VHHEVASGCRQGYLRMHPHQDNNGRARNVDDPNYHATNATILFLPASSVDRFPCRNRLMRSQVSFIIVYIYVASRKFAQTWRYLCWHMLRDIDLYAIVLNLVQTSMQQCWYCNLLHHVTLWVAMSIIKLKQYLKKKQILKRCRYIFFFIDSLLIMIPSALAIFPQKK